MIVALTGHRPEKILEPNLEIMTRLRAEFKSRGVTHVIQGMAAGFDIIGAAVAYKAGIPYTCAIPWRGHTPRTGEEIFYQKVKQCSTYIHFVDDAEKYPGPWVYHNRNHWMVDNADFVIAYWNGDTKGGTAECVKYAKKKNKEIVNIYGEVISE